MPDTVEHRVAMHRLAAERRKAGLPIWDRKVNLADVFHNERMSFEQSQDAIVQRLRSSQWHAEAGEDSELWEAIDRLADAEDVQAFDAVWNEIYDLADWDRVWIATF